MADKTIPQLPITSEANPTDVLPVVQGGVARHTLLSTIINLVFRTLGVTENENGTSIRIPVINKQVCWGKTATHAVTEGDGSGVRTSTQNHNFPQPFKTGTTPTVIGGVHNAAGNVGGCYANADGHTRFLYRLYAQASGSGAVQFVAWGDY